MGEPINGILLLYHWWLVPNAPTIAEHMGAFERHSRFKVWAVNTALEFPAGLSDLDFQIIVLHYSLFGWYPFSLSKRFLEYVERSHRSYKIAFFQDEYRYWPQRVELINRCKIQCVYTLLQPANFKDTYLKYTHAPKLISTLPGYVSDDLMSVAQELTKPERDRTIDIGYRGRRLPYLFGRGSQEKHEIGRRFRERAHSLGLKLDLESREDKRLYGRKYYSFLADCRAVLGVEAGVSICDIDDVVRPAYERLLAENSRISIEEAHAQLLYRYEDNIPYRTISPRHFEAAALRVCQILFEGEYSGVMKAMVHYIPLKKDFSNFDEVIHQFKNKKLRHDLTENAYRDLIASGRYSYRRFVEGFDEELSSAGFKSEIATSRLQQVTELLNRGITYRRFRTRITSLRYRHFPGRRFVAPMARSVLRRVSGAGWEQR